jgi:hypothetical protein
MIPWSTWDANLYTLKNVLHSCMILIGSIQLEKATAVHMMRNQSQKNRRLMNRPKAPRLHTILVEELDLGLSPLSLDYFSATRSPATLRIRAQALNIRLKNEKGAQGIFT